MIKSAGNGYVSIVSKLNGLYLDASGGVAKNGTNIQVYTRNGTNSQKFKLEATNSTQQGGKTIENGTYSIESALSSNYVLDVKDGSKTNGANIQLYKKQSANRQKFKVEYLGNGYYSIKAQHSGKSMDVAGRRK